MPPWMSFELRLLVPAAQSVRSTSATESPRSTASRATPTPVMPPPMTRTSGRAAGRAASVAARVSGENGATIRRAGLPVGAQLGEDCRRFGNLVGAVLVLRDLQGALRERERFRPVPARFARLRERQAGRERVRVLLDHLPQHRLALLDVAAEQAGQADEERSLGGEGVGVTGLDLERAVELAQELPQLEDR